MDSDEELTALKKAYADIILNTAKEAAARILVSERKASRYLYELNMAKEEGVRMLLLLKQMSDAKVREAEAISTSQQSKIKQLQTQLENAEDMIIEGKSLSLNQHRKVDELEAQLHEAEDIVKDLRDDLRNVRAELDQLNNIQSVSEASQLPTITASQSPDGFVSDLTDSYPNQPILIPLSQQLETVTASATGFLIKESSTIMSHLPSIILRRRKDGGSYRNQRTQRIHAFKEKQRSEVSIMNKGKEVESPIKPSYRKRKRAGKDKRNASSTETEREEVVVASIMPGEEANCNNDDLQSPVAETDAEMVKASGSEEITGHGEKQTLFVSSPKKEQEKTDQRESNRLIRFTFQRKRKKETTMASASLEKEANEAGAADKQIEPVETKKKESSHDSRRAAQVARQLISLSEKKWWN